MKKILNGVEVDIPSSEVASWDAQVLGPVATLAVERATMDCTPMQGILALGEANWNTILTYRETASWQEKIIIDSAQTWVRNSQNIAFFQYLLGFTDTQVDDLFCAAMLIDA